MDEARLPALPWPGFSPERAFVLPLPAARMATPFGDACEFDGVRLRRKAEFHATVLSQEMSRAAAAGLGVARLRALYESLSWRPRRSGRYALLHKAGSGDAGTPDSWSLIEYLDLPAMHAFRDELAGQLGQAFADPVPHVTHYVRGEPNGIGVPHRRALAALLVREVAP
ncbi:MAG TPA: hypothetical protein VFH59_08370 [Frateuria sp.]|uniref:hypothetical protein n=1 Tax=Frateuria sp. TaxID=2211372 RepID=UPI002D7FC689|nr:hypothetical protein [Frateuria sp.]HET6805437.1 hypothetical protein [Frateuria sp.]